MATARLTFAECWSLIRKFIEIVNYHFHGVTDGAGMTTAAKCYSTLEDAFQAGMDGARSRELLTVLYAMRSDHVSFILRAQELYRLLVIEMARSSAVNSPAGEDFERAYRDCWLYMHDNNQWVRRRLMSYGSPAASGLPVGTGSWYRVTTDQKAYTIESTQVDVLTAECVFDKRTGTTSGQELFEMRGRAAGRDILEQLGAGRAKPIQVTSEDTGLLDSAGFEGTFQSSGTTLLGDWTCTAAGNMAANSVAYYRGAQSCQFNANDTLIQNITNINRNVPHFACIRYKQNTANGVLTLTVGSKTAAVTLTAGAAGSWTDLYIALDSNCWPDNFIQNSTQFKITWAVTAAAHGVLVDSCIFAPMTEFNGHYHVLTAGATDWAVNDKWTATDTASEIGVIQFWTKLLLGRYWPHKGTASYNITDPTLV
jgi:hypothetical protein